MNSLPSSSGAFSAARRVFGYVLLFAALPLAICFAQQRIEIPGTNGAALSLPPGWNAGPGGEGAVLSLLAPDGNAQVMVNLLSPNPGQDLGQFADLMADQTRQQVLNAGLPVNPRPTQRPVLGGRQFRVESFPINDPTQPLLLEFAFTLLPKQLLVFNISAAQQSPQRLAEARQAVQSLSEARAAPPATNVANGSPFEREAQLMRWLSQQGYRREWETALADARAEISALKWREGQFEASVAYLSSAVELDPSHADRLELLADLLDDCPAPAAPFLAQSYYEDALALEPDNRPCRLKLAASYQATGEFADAITHYEILAQNPGGPPDPTPLQNLCLLYLSTNREARGDAFLEPIVMSGAPPEFGIAWAIIKNARGDHAEGIRLARWVASAATTPALRDYSEQLARSFEKQGGSR